MGMLFVYVQKREEVRVACLLWALPSCRGTALLENCLTYSRLQSTFLVK